ncbi:MAG: NADH:flavin oxidoreductase [Kofleriaceae bacterium]|nr:NADH:flavin oxidoreductase [Kofleriaceae bacterium]
MSIPPLMQPLELRPGLVAKNRVWLAPLTNLQSHADGTLGDDELHFLAGRADGGFGLIETCAAYVASDGKAWAGELGVHSDAMVPGLTRLAARMHQSGALAAVQLFHGGLRANPSVSGASAWTASAYQEGTAPAARAGSDEDIERVIAAFADAAQRCAAAGFDAVELHGAHGYLLSQFLSTVYNQRTDRWGGSLENRARLIRSVMRAVKAAAPGLLCMVRLSPEDFGQAKGLDLDETIQVARWLAEDGMDILHLSLWQCALNTTKKPDAHPTTLFRASLGPAMRIVVAGKIWTRADGETQLALGADAVALGRSAIANPDWPTRAHDSTLAIRQPPLSAAELLDRGLSPTFANYLRNWKGFVVEESPTT